MSSPSVIPQYLGGPLNTGSALGNTAVSTGIRTAGSLVPLPGAGSIIGGVGTGLVTGNWNWRNFVPFGWMIPGKKIPYGMVGSGMPMAVPGPGFNRAFGLGPIQQGPPPYSDFLAPSINASNFFQGMPTLPQFNAQANYTGDPLSLLMSQIAGTYAQPNMPGVAPININTSVMNQSTVPKNGNLYTGLNNPQQFAPQTQGNLLSSGYGVGAFGQGSMPGGDMAGPLTYMDGVQMGSISPATGFFSGGSANSPGMAGWLYGPFNKAGMNLARQAGE